MRITGTPAGDTSTTSISSCQVCDTLFSVTDFTVMPEVGNPLTAIVEG
jgi:hypothetical protein